MALLLRLRRARTRTDTLTNPPLLHHLFSTFNAGGGGDDNNNDGIQPSSNSNPSISSHLSEVRKTLKQQSPSKTRSSPLSPPASPNSQQQGPSLDEILKNIQGYRNRGSAPPSDTPSQQKPISFQEIYNKMQKRPGSEPLNPGGGGGGGGGTALPFDTIRGSLRQLGDKKGGRMSFLGGTNTLPESVFGREMRERIEGDGHSTTNLEFVRSYRHHELGERLRELRPQVKGKEWFSIGELNERLKKVREMDDLKSKSTHFGDCTMVVRDALTNIEANKDDKSKKPSMYKVDMLALLGGTPTYMTKPPKEHLVEKYFHPDNMSSAEKLKIELAKVRDEFKMSESDCGSARVQVAQLTTKIKHLSSMLHKKDVHSRKGLLAMVQRRKKLLKYLRRTDWDSYCFVISKLGLRDNPEHSYKTRTGRAGDIAA